MLKNKRPRNYEKKAHPRSLGLFESRHCNSLSFHASFRFVSFLRLLCHRSPSFGTYIGPSPFHFYSSCCLCPASLSFSLSLSHIETIKQIPAGLKLVRHRRPNMKAKTAEPTKSSATKKTPLAKKTPATKIQSTPKPSATTPPAAPSPAKTAAKKSMPKSAASSKIKVEEAENASKEVTRPAEKKTVRKGKSPAVAKTRAASSSKKVISVMKEEEEEEPAATMQEERITAVKEEPAAIMEEEDSDEREEETVAAIAAVEDAKVNKSDSDNDEDDPEEQPEEEIGEEMQEYGGDEKFEEPGEEECMDDDFSDPEGDGVEGGITEELQMQISDAAQERKRNKELEIFVGGLERDAEEEDVRKAFAKVGDVVEVRLLKNPLTNKNKGFAFVKFATKEQADRALSELKSPIV